MLFTNSERNFRIELNNPYECRLSMLDGNMHLLQGLNRMLASYVRSAPLDGNEPAGFKHRLEETNIIIGGNIIKAISALCELDWIKKDLQDDIMEQVILMMASQVKARISPARQESFADKLNTTLRTTEQSHYTPGVFC